MKSKPLSRIQSGVMLLEALIAILIFAIGILGIVGLQATAIKQSTDAQFRSDAGLLTSQLLGDMWLSDRSTANLQTEFATNQTIGSRYDAWKKTVLTTLPKAAQYPPVVAVSNDGVVTITVRWLAPNEPANSQPHQLVTVAQVR